MLRELHIENIAIIEKADVEFCNGLNILTGETGAGKSIMIDSIGAVLGERLTKDIIRRGADAGMVTAVFESSPYVDEWLEKNDFEVEEELIVQRKIGQDGKSRCRINGNPTPVNQLRSLSSLLIDIHGQNDGRLLLDERKHLEYLDRFVQPEKEFAAFQIAYTEYRTLKKEMDSLEFDEIEKAHLTEKLKYQIEELEAAKLKSGEYEKIEKRIDLLRNSEKLTETLQAAVEALNGGEANALSFLTDAIYYAEKASNYVEEFEKTTTALEDARFALQDAYETLKDYWENLDFSPAEYDKLELRFAQLNKLERKYNRPIEELIPHLEECREKLDTITYADERLAKLQKLLKKQEALCKEAAAALTEKRKAGALLLKERIESELKALSMPSVQFMVQILPADGKPGFNATGADEVAFLMSANAGEAPGKINKIASGGELSRIMLAMKNVFSENDPVGTLIFDEIDTGVSGIAAQRVAEKLYSVSVGRQVMCVTHLPQIAAMADAHFKIQKNERNGRTFTEIQALENEGKQAELARMYGGDNITALTLAGAEEQLQAAARFKAAYLGR